MLNILEEQILKKDYEDTQQKFIVLSGFPRCGASKKAGIEYWSRNESVIAYLDSNGKVIKEKLYFTRIGKTPEEINFNFEKLTVYEILCVKKINVDSVFYVLDYKKTDDFNDKFADIIKEQSTPVVVTIENIDFTLDRRLNHFEGDTVVDGKKLHLFINADNLTISENSSKLLSDLINNFNTNYEEMISSCTKELTPLANEWNEESDTEITKEEFSQRLRKSNLDVDISDSSLTVYFDDDDMFWGHTIEYYKNFKTQETSANICG